MELTAPDPPTPSIITLVESSFYYPLLCLLTNIYIHPHLYLSMAATTLLRVAALAAPHPPIKPTNRNSFACLSLTPKRQTHLKSHCSSLKFTPLQFSHRVLKRHRFGLGSVCFASSGETTGTQEVEEEVQEAQLEVVHLLTHP